MKRGAKLAVLLVALLVLTGAWLLAENLSGRREAELAEHAHADLIDISAGEAEDITAIAWDYFGDTASLYCEDGVWLNANDERCPVDGDAVQPLVQAVAGLQAFDEIGDVTDFDQYGLADCAFTVIAGSADRTVTYDIGKTTADGAYYVRVDGADTVYTATSILAETFQIKLDDVLKLETVPQDIDLVTSVSVDTDAGAYELEYISGGEEVWYTPAYTWFLLDENGEPSEPLDAGQTEALYTLATGIALTDCETWNAASLADYGLDEPQGTVRVEYLDRTGQAQSFGLEFGGYDNGDVFVHLSDSNMVYRVPGTVLDGLMYPDFAAMEPLTPAALDWDKLQSMYLELGDDSYSVSRNVSTPTEAGEEPEDIFITGERSLDAGKVDDWLEQVGKLTADSRTAPTEGREKLFSLTFYQDSELYPEVTVAFRAYDSVHYLCVVNGAEYYLVSRTAAESVRDEALEFLTKLPE